MKKKVFLVGKLYDLATISAQDIQTDVQNRLDAHYGSGCIIFKINVWKQSKEVAINFRRSYNDWYKGENDKTIFCADADLLTGRGVDGFKVPDMWPTAPFGYPFSTGIEDFVACYKNSAKELGASRIKDIHIGHCEKNLNVRLFY